MSEELRRVLVGFDGSSRAVDALHLARTIAYAEDAELMVASVYEPESIFDAGDRYLPPVDEEKARAKRDSEMRRVFAQVDLELGGRHYERRELWGSPAGELTALAEAAAADVIVVGSTHQGKIGRVLPGSVGERLLQGSPCAVAVAVAPSGYAEERQSAIRTIGVGYTGTAESRQALGWAQSLARRVGARLRLIGVVPEFNPAHFPGLVGVPDYRTLVRDDVEKALASAAGRINDAEVGRRILDGDPAGALTEQGSDLDLLVVGSRGYGPLRRVLLGGVSGRVIQNAPCPVVVAPRSAERKPRQGDPPPYVAAQF